MEIVSVRPGVWVLRGRVNLGVIGADGEALFVDAGLDEGPARRLWRWAEERGLRLRAALLAHADHFGGTHPWEAQGLPLLARFTLAQPIPFCYDVAQALKNLDTLGSYEVVGPGHGGPLAGMAVHAAIQAFRTRLLALVEETEKALSVPRSGEELVGILAQRLGAQNLNLVGFLLARTTVHVVLPLLVREGRAEAFLENGVLR